MNYFFRVVIAVICLAALTPLLAQTPPASTFYIARGMGAEAWGATSTGDYNLLFTETAIRTADGQPTGYVSFRACSYLPPGTAGPTYKTVCSYGSGEIPAGTIRRGVQSLKLEIPDVTAIPTVYGYTLTCELYCETGPLTKPFPILVTVTRTNIVHGDQDGSNKITQTYPDGTVVTTASRGSYEWWSASAYGSIGTVPLVPQAYAQITESHSVSRYTTYQTKKR
jgi:hypothetical protein